MIKNKLRYYDIIAESYYLEKNNGIVLIFCSGIPGISNYPEIAEKFANKGFIFIHPKYFGTWESYGQFTIDGCKKTIVDFANALINKKVKNIFKEQFNLRHKQIFLLGHSFGGSVALCAGADLNCEGIIALAPVIDYKAHGREAFKEEVLDELYGFIVAGFENSIRGIKRTDWEALCSGSSTLNASDYIGKLKHKKILLLHGKEDGSVSPIHSHNFYSKLKNMGADITYEETQDNHSSIKVNSINKIASWTEK